MNISAPFIRRPVMTTILMAALLLFGSMAYRQLPVSDLPNVDYPSLQVSASLPGASPETMASAVATPLERQFSTIAGIDSMNSSSGAGTTTITLQFNLARDIDAAAQDVQAAIARSLRQLPADMPAPPTYQKVNPADQPILLLALTSPTMPLSQLNEYGETILGQRISMVDGVAQVQVYGAQKYAVRVQLDPRALAARAIGFDEVSDSIDRANVNLPTGILYGPHRAFTLQANGQLYEAASYRPLIVAYRNGAPVRLGELGRVFDSVENNKSAAWYCTPERQQRAIVLAVQRQPGRNTIEVADAVKALLPSFRAQLPPSVSLNLLIDRSVPIRDSTHDVQFVLGLTLVLVVLVIFVFLRNLPATIIPSLALPLSLVGTFAVMYLLDYSLDNLSLMALTLALGFVVDDAIVMLENIVRHVEMGKDRRTAALDGSREIGFTIVSMTISLAAVFIPFIFMGGLVGRLFREFAVTIGIAVLVSGVVSLTLTPMLASRFLKAGATAQHGRIYALTERGFERLLRFYDGTLSAVLGRPRTTLLFSLIVLAATVYLFQAIPKGFLPSEDRGQIFVQTEAEEGISYTAMFERQQALASAMQQEPSIEAFMSSGGAGGRGVGGGNSGRMFARLKPRDQRTLSADEVVQSLRRRLAAVPGIRAYPQNPPAISVGGIASRSQYQYTLQGPDTEELYRSAAQLLARLRQRPELQDVTSDMQLKNPELDVDIDRDLASSLGVSAGQIESALYQAYGSRQVSTIFAPNNQYQVIMEVLPEYQRDPAALGLLHVRSARGELVPIRAIARLKEGVGPTTINHLGQLPAVTISFNLRPGVSLGDAVGEVGALARAIVPPTISTSFQGTAQAFQSSMRGMRVLLVLALVVIYMVLAILYESFYHPVTILSALPFAGAGALVTLLLFRAELSLYAFVGIILLIGLVKKNGIMMVDFAIAAQREAGLSPSEAIHRACLIRFRPIMMTTMAALAGGLPLALGYGAGGESRRPLGLAVVGGLLFSQFLTLYVTPVFYVGMEWLLGRMRRRRATGSSGAVRPAAALALAAAIGIAAAAAASGQTAAGPSAQPLALSVREAVLMALEHNRALAVERLRPEISRTAEDEQRAAFDPVLSGSAARQESDLERLSTSGAGVQRVETRATTADATLSETLPAGTRLSAGASAGVTDSSSASNDFASARVGVAAAQPLLRGAGRAVGLANLRLARLGTLDSQYELRGFAEALVAAVEGAYWDCLRTQRQIEIVDESLRLAERQLEEARERVRIGKLAPSEVAASEAEVALRLQARIAARGAVETTRLAYLRLLNPSGSNRWDRAPVLTDSLADPVDADDADVGGRVRTALRARPDLNQARLALERGDLELVKTRDGLLPKLDLFAALGKTGYADAVGEAVRDVNGSDTYDATLGVQFEYPVRRRAAAAQHRRAVLQKEQAAGALEALEQLAEVDVRRACVDVASAREQVAAAAATCRAQEASLAAEQEKFRQGKSTTLMVAQAARDLLGSRIVEVQALVGYRKALVDLYRQEGTLLERRGLSVADGPPDARRGAGATGG